MKTIANKDSSKMTFAEYLLFKNNADKVAKLHRVRATSSGSIIGNGLVLTAAHAIDRNEAAKILYRQKVVKARILERMPKIDVMLLEFEDSEFEEQIPHLELSFEPVTLGQKVFGVSFPLADEMNFQPTFYNSDVSSVKIENESHLFKLNSELSEGCSGMNVVNEFAKVVGVVNSRAEALANGGETPADWNFATSTRYFWDSIQKYLPKRLARHNSRLSTESIAKKLTQTSVVVLACERD
jgi:S1-C subfamily serine protease